MDKRNKHKQDPILDFFKGATKGIILTGLMLGLTLAVGFIPGAALLPETFGLMQGVGIMLVSGILNGAMSVYHGAKIQKQLNEHTMRSDVQIVESSPTIVPLLGVGHGVSVEHALEIEDTQAAHTNWASRTQKSGDRVQEILRNGSMSDKDRASAILAEREQRGTIAPGISA